MALNFIQGGSCCEVYYFEEGGRNISRPGSGVLIGDTIVAINGEEVGNVNRAAELLEKAGAGPVNCCSAGR